jgi:hypothetical protein
MLQSAFDSGLRPDWVVADEVYGNDGKFWWWLDPDFSQVPLPNLLEASV